MPLEVSLSKKFTDASQLVLRMKLWVFRMGVACSDFLFSIRVSSVMNEYVRDPGNRLRFPDGSR